MNGPIGGDSRHVADDFLTPNEECAYCHEAFFCPGSAMKDRPYWFDDKYGSVYCTEECINNAGEAAEQARYGAFHDGGSYMYTRLDVEDMHIRMAGR